MPLPILRATRAALSAPFLSAASFFQCGPLPFCCCLLSACLGVGVGVRLRVGVRVRVKGEGGGRS